MIEEWYAVNIYFLVVFDINLDVTLCSLLAGGVPTVFLVLPITAPVVRNNRSSFESLSPVIRTCSHAP